MDNILNIIKKIIPKGILKRILPVYHITMAYFAAFWYGYPSEKMIVIGVTGTNGKSTTTELIARVLEKGHTPLSAQAGREGNSAQHPPNPPQGGNYKVGFTSTVKFKAGDKEWLNDKKMTMVGRFYLQKLLRDMARAGCKYAVIETSSEGVKQFRHKGINYDYLVFTNLTPEHIESHGSFENYKNAKLELFRHLEKCRRKKLVSSILPAQAGKYQVLSKQGISASESMDDTREVGVSKNLSLPPFGKGGNIAPKVIIVNGDDKYASEFLNFKVDKKVVYGVESAITGLTPPLPPSRGELIYRADNVRLDKTGMYFNITSPSFEEGVRGRFSKAGTGNLDGVEFKLNMLGRFNVYNALPSIIIGENEGMRMEEIKEALAEVKGVPGRMEFIDEGQDFTVLVDYAPEPESMKKLYKTVLEINSVISNGFNRIIHVFGSCGGGRDKARRPILGRIAAENADIVIITNEDPYDDDPMEIIEEVAEGAKESLKFKARPEFAERVKSLKEGEDCLYKILDRREAIRKALELAKSGDLVIITGKGSEQFICVADGKKIPWDDREVVREEILKNHES